MDKILTIALLLLGTLSAAQQTVGLFQNEPGAYNGYTLLNTQDRNAYLIDNCGEVVHSWQSAFAPGMSAYLLEDGHLVRAGRVPGEFNTGGVGGRLEKFDWEGNLVWSYEYATDSTQQHHDFAVLPNGNILFISWELRTADEAIAAGRNPNLTPSSGIWSEQVIEIQPVGTDEAEIVWEWHLWDHLIQNFDENLPDFGTPSEYPERVNVNFGAMIAGPNSRDWIHLNAIDYNADLDQIVLSSRNFNEIWIIDHSTDTETASGHTGGNAGKGGDLLYRWGNPRAYGRGGVEDQQLFGQHDPNWIAEGMSDAGKILVYNNGINRPEGDYSSVEILELPLNNDGGYDLVGTAPYLPISPFWSYSGEAPGDIYSSNVSGAQRLPNGNTLICEGQPGRVSEVDTFGTVQWTYINPVEFGGPIAQGSVTINALLFRAYRYGTDYPAFEGRDLEPIGPLEIDPLPSDCQIYDGMVSIFDPQDGLDIKLFPNPVIDYIYVEHIASTDLQLRILDSQGRLEAQRILPSGTTTIDMSNWAAGLYFVQILGEENDLIRVEKIVRL